MYFITLAIPVLSGTFWEMSSVRDSLTMECMVSFNDNNRELRQQRQLGLQLRKCHLKDVFHASNFMGLIPSRSIHQMLPIFSRVVKDCIKVQSSKFLCSRSPQNVKLGILTS